MVSVSLSDSASKVSLTLSALFVRDYAHVDNNFTHIHAIIQVEKDCERGYICTSGSDIPNPTDGAKGYICPAGSYCLAGATSSELCEVNTYQPSEGISTLNLFSLAKIYRIPCVTLHS